MLARCARCQGTFTTDRFGLQTCPHCGSELLLSDPNAPPSEATPPAVAPPPPPAPSPPPAPWSAPAPGASPGWASQAPPPAAPASAGAPPAPELPAPFAARKERGFFRGFFQTWRLAALDPGSFFRRVRVDQTGSAVLFAVIAASVGMWVTGIFSWLTRAGSIASLRQVLEQLPPGTEAARQFGEQMIARMESASLLQELVQAPVIAVGVLFGAAGLVHVLLLVLRGAGRGFGATLTAAGYAGAPALLLALPMCGFPIAIVWSLVVFIIGLGETQRCGTGKAAAAVLLPALLACACACAGIAFFTMAAMGGGAAGVKI
jgi:hypothetical protein